VAVRPPRPQGVPALGGRIKVAGVPGTRVGDSVAVAKDGFQYLTGFPREFTGF
jgi:Xaa-Pro aminopeptidase